MEKWCVALETGLQTTAYVSDPTRYPELRQGWERGAGHGATLDNTVPAHYLCHDPGTPSHSWKRVEKRGGNSSPSQRAKNPRCAVAPAVVAKRKAQHSASRPGAEVKCPALARSKAPPTAHRHTAWSVAPCHVAVAVASPGRKIVRAPGTGNAKTDKW